MRNQLQKFSTLVEGLDHPEGVAWSPDGHVYAGGEAGQIYRVDLEARTFSEVANTGGFVLGIAFDADGNCYACDMGRGDVARVWLSKAAGKAKIRVDSYSKGTAEEPSRGPNYPVFDGRGNLYYSENGDWGKDNGLLYRVDPAGRTSVWSRAPRRFTNGLALDPKGRYLYCVESTLPGVSRVAILPDGSAGDYEVVARMRRTVPDGLAFGADGTLYISLYYPDRIYSLAPGGSLQLVAEDFTHTPLCSPTNLAFCGPRLDRLVVANLCGWHLAVADLGVRGAPLHHPKLS